MKRPGLAPGRFTLRARITISIPVFKKPGEKGKSFEGTRPCENAPRPIIARTPPYLIIAKRAAARQFPHLVIAKRAAARQSPHLVIARSVATWQSSSYQTARSAAI
jgi:hypothetical protein